MNLTHIVGLRLLRGAGQTASPPAPTPELIGRRRRTRTYKTPTPEALQESYAELAEAAPQEVKKLIGSYLLRGDSVGIPKPAAIDWQALARDADTVVKFFDLYIEHIEEEDDLSVILLSDF